MEYTVQVIIERAGRIRRQLADLEKQVKPGSEVPEDLWEEIQKLSEALDKEVRRAETASRIIAKQVNDTRTAIIETLEKYNHWREQMRQVEELFLVHIVRPGYRLRQAVHQREFLETGYHRLRRNIDIEHYDGLEDLKSDILSVLKLGDETFDTQDEEVTGDDDRKTTIFDLMEDFDVDQLVDEIEKESVVRDYKRIVLPEIHPDTSNAPAETFKTVYEVYEKRDYLLMEGYIVQYRGEIIPDPIEDPFIVLDEIDQYQEDYANIKTRLDHRMDRLWRELSPQERENPDQLKDKLRSQQSEINEKIHEEAEQILQLRQQIEDLAKYYLDSKR